MPTRYEQANPHSPLALSNYPNNSQKPLRLVSPPRSAWIKVRFDIICHVPGDSDPVWDSNPNLKGRTNLTQTVTCRRTYNVNFEYQVLALPEHIIYYISTAYNISSHSFLVSDSSCTEENSTRDMKLLK